MGLDKSCALYHRRRLRRHQVAIGHVSPEAAAGGPIALVHEGDVISIDIDAGTLTLRRGLEARRAAWQPPAPNTPRECSPATQGSLPVQTRGHTLMTTLEEKMAMH